MNNQRGGILSKLFAIPVGVALMVGFFFLGYYVGKYQSKSNTQTEALPPLPDVASKYLPKKDEFTFYKTLTDKEDKTVSIDLKPKPPVEENKAKKKESSADAGQDKEKKQPKPERQIEIKIDKPAAPTKQTASVPPQVQAKKEPAPAVPNNKVRYTIQIASYPESEMAEEEVKRMKKRGYAAFIVTSEVPDKGTWYRVRLGSFSNKAAAERLQEELRTKEGLSPFITIE